MMNRLKNKIVLITGGNSGIGYAAASTLKSEGATVIITGRRADAVAQAAAELGVRGIVADQSSLSDLQQLFDTLRTEYGRIDVLFINAGISKMFSVEESSEALFDETMNINFKGAYFTLSKAIPLLPEGASVIFLSSIVAHAFHHSSSIYSASKAALNALMKTAAIELAPKKIRVNAVSPGPTKTEVMNKSGLDPALLHQVMSAVTGKIPLARMAEADEISKAVLFFADHDSSSFVTGAELIIDGGLTLV